MLPCSAPDFGVVPTSENSLQGRSKQRDPLTRYVTDVIEIPFDVHTTIIETDAKQRTSVHTSRHKFQITSSRSPVDGQAKLTSSMSHGVRYPRFHEYDLDQTLLAVVIGLRILESSAMTSIEFGGENCYPFEAHGNRFRLRSVCGVLRSANNRAGEVPEPISIQVAGLPQTFGKVTVLRYSFRQEFQSVTVAGDSIPLILPKRCIGEFDFENGTLRVESTYTPVVKRGA